MANKGKTQLLITWVASPDKVSPRWTDWLRVMARTWPRPMVARVPTLC